MQGRKNKVSLQIFHYVDQTFPFLRSNVSVSTIKRFRFYDQTFPFLWSNVSVSTIKRFCFYDQTFLFLRSNVSVSTIKRFRYIITMKTTVKRLPLFAKIKLLHSDYEYSN